METRDCLVGFLIMLALSQGCVDTGNLPGMGPKEVSVDLSTPEGVIEAYWKYLDVGEYDEAYELFCDDEYFSHLKSVSPMFSQKDKFIAYARGAYGEKGEKIDSGSPKIIEKTILTGYEARIYGMGKLSDEGYYINCEAGKRSRGIRIIGGG